MKPCNHSIYSARYGTVIITAYLLFYSAMARAADFTIVGGQTVTTQQTLTNSETGLIENGGNLTVNAVAIQLSGNNVLVNNNGSISTTGDYSFGITSQATNAVITNNGSISTTSDYSFGIHSQATNAIITNNGSILTTRDFSYGVFSIGANAITTNYGSISTSGDYGSGIFSMFDHSVITNNGSILTAGDFGTAIFSGGDDTAITNNGSISTSGDTADGVFSGGIGDSIINNGSISTSGNGSYGISSTGANAVINNSGLLSATGVGSAAILAGNNDVTLNLLAGSRIIGKIDLGNNGADNDTVNVYSGSVSAHLIFENTENINLFGAGVLNGNSVTTIDATGESSRDVALSQLTSSVHNLISQRMRYASPLEPVQLAASTLFPGIYFESHKPVAWAQLFGGKFNRDAQHTSLAYDIRHSGINLGYEWALQQTRIGLIGGFARAKTDTQIASFQTETDSYYVGAYGYFKLGLMNLTSSLITGYSDNANDRLVIDNITGYQVARSDVGNLFVSPSITLSGAFKTAERVELRPAISLNYSMAWLDDYQETGTNNSNLNIDSRTVAVLTARAQLAAALQLNEATELEFRAGLNTRHGHSDNVDGQLAGQPFSYANVGDDRVSGRFAGVNLRIAAENNLNLVVDMEFGGNNRENYVSSHLSLDYVF